MARSFSLFPLEIYFEIFCYLTYRDLRVLCLTCSSLNRAVHLWISRQKSIGKVWISSEGAISPRVRELKVFTAYFSGTLPLDFILDSISQLDGLSGVDSYETIYRSPQFLSHKKARALLREFSISHTATLEAYENLGFMVGLENLRMHTPPPPTRSSMAKYHLPNLKTIMIFFEKGEIPFVQGEHLPELTNLNFWERASLSPPAFQVVKRHLSQLSNLTVPFSWELCEALNECDDLSRLELLKLNFFETESQLDLGHGAPDPTLLFDDTAPGRRMCYPPHFDLAIPQGGNH